MDLDVEFEINPKLQALTEILDGLKNQQKPPTKNKRSKGGSKNNEPKLLKEVNSEHPQQKKTLLIAVKTPKICLDIQRFLISKYSKKNHNIFYEEKLKFILGTHREFFRR